jgi:hypothetical protein
VSAGLPRLTGGVAKRDREAWSRPCRLGDGRPAAGLVETALGGPQPICEEHIPGAEARGYSVRRREVEGADQ